MITIRGHILVSRTNDDPLLPVCMYKTPSVCTFKTFPCVRAPRVHVSTHVRVAGIHGDVLNAHTEAFLNPHTVFFHVFFSVHKHTQTHTHTERHTTTNNNTTTTTTHHHTTPQHTTPHGDRDRERQRQRETGKERQRRNEKMKEKRRNEKMEEEEGEDERRKKRKKKKKKKDQEKKKREYERKEFFFRKMFQNLQPRQRKKPNMFRKKNPFRTNYSSIFSSKVQNLTVFSIIYMIRIRFFGRGANLGLFTNRKMKKRRKMKSGKRKLR